MKFAAIPYCFAGAVLAMALSAGAVAAGPPAGVQGAMSRDQARGAPPGKPSTLTVGDAQKASAAGLPGLKEGDVLEVSRGPDGKWVVRDPATGNTATLAEPPDFGR